MRQKPETSKNAADKLVKNIRRKTRQTYSAEEKIRIVLAGLRGEESISVLCRREGSSGGGSSTVSEVVESRFNNFVYARGS
ncbi:hypothetical protein IMCC20628_04729 (plasmid) [Hoeflea sp. IMCC20628]|nr:hypothetical protein IMCC20628_04729 [Hoeflea sp. IMCC20628]